MTRSNGTGSRDFTTIEISHAGELSVLPVAQAADLELEKIGPVRRSQFYEGQKYKPGFWWSSTVGRLVPYESVNERAALITLDHDTDVTWIVAQPCRLRFADSSTHVPDFLTRTSEGARRMLDVTTTWRLSNRPATEASFEATAKVCQELGWDYVVVLDVDFDRQFLVNLLYLANFRHDPGPASAYTNALLDAASEPLELRELVGQIGPKSLIWPLAMHHIWHGNLRLDVYGDIEGTTLVARELVDVLTRGRGRDPYFPTSLEWEARVRRQRLQHAIFTSS